jgi:type IX secretion system PorP/SprF family membrane protein
MNLCCKFYWLVFLLLPYFAKAQQDIQFTQFSQLGQYYNPALTGIEGTIVADLGVRWQWSGIEGSPISQVASASMPFLPIKGNVGLAILNDKAAAHRSTQVTTSYSYSKKFTKFNLLVGGALGLLQYGLKGNLLTTPEGNYSNTINHNDPKLTTTLASGLIPDLAVGIVAYSQQFNFGVSVTHLIAPKLNFKFNNTKTSVNYKPTLHLHGGYTIIANNYLTIKPSLLYKSDFVKATLDVITVGTYNEKYQVGVGFRGFRKRNFDAIALLFGYQLKPNVLLMYSYDLTTSSLIKASFGSHELSLHYKLPKISTQKRGKIIYNPRFL